MKNQKGFLLLEALTAMLILSVTLAAFIGVAALALRISARAENMTRSLLKMEDLLFQLESGARADWIAFGGRGNEDNYDYEISSTPLEDPYYSVKSRLSQNSRTVVEIETFLSAAAGT